MNLLSLVGFRVVGVVRWRGVAVVADIQVLPRKWRLKRRLNGCYGN